MSLVRLEVGVDVLLAILRIDEVVETVTGRVVVVDVDDANRHFRVDDVGWQGQPVAIPEAEWAARPVEKALLTTTE